MSKVIQRKYNVLLTTAKSIEIDLYEVDGIDLRTDATFATGDIKISKDGGTEVDTSNLPTDEGQGYRLILTAAELTASRVKLIIVDQTATKAWLDTVIHIETYGNASAMHAFDLDTASVAQTADHTAGIADVPTVSEFNARTQPTADYFDPATDTVANVTLVATTTTNTDMAGTNNALLASSYVDHTATIADIPTVAEFNARTLVAASYFDPATDTVANVTTVATTTTNTDMVGTDGANTVAPDNASITLILADTGELQTNQGNWVTATGFATSGALATVDSNVDAVKVATDKLTFTVANQLDSNIQSVNDVTITGDGSGSPFDV